MTMYKEDRLPKAVSPLRKRKVAKKTPKKKKPTVNTPDLIKVLIGVVILFILIILFRSA